jgi:hypothetical protein
MIHQQFRAILEDSLVVGLVELLGELRLEVLVGLGLAALRRVELLAQLLNGDLLVMHEEGELRHGVRRQAGAVARSDRAGEEEHAVALDKALAQAPVEGGGRRGTRWRRAGCGRRPRGRRAGSPDAPGGSPGSPSRAPPRGVRQVLTHKVPGTSGSARLALELLCEAGAGLVGVDDKVLFGRAGSRDLPVGLCLFV